MTVRQLIDGDFNFHATIIVRSYKTGEELLNTFTEQWNLPDDIPVWILDSRLFSLATEDGSLLLTIDDDDE